MTSATTPTFRLPKAMQPIFHPKRYKVFYGGRGSAKSWSVARTLVLVGTQRRLRIMCVREFQGSLSESVHQLLRDQIGEMGLSGFYTVLEKSILGINGTEFIFAGIRSNPNKIKSTEGVDICWVEEAEKVSNRSWELLIPTIRKPGSEIWVTFNPDEGSDPTWKRFVVSPPPPSDAMVIKVNWRDNPWFPETLKKEKDYLLRVDPEAAEHVWEGGLRKTSNAQVFRGKYIVDSFTPNLDWNGPYFGADWGFAQDPSVLIKCWIFNRNLLIEHEAYGLGVELNKLAELFDTVPDSREHLIRADSARPETISHVAGFGFKIVPVKKWPGSIEDGVSYLRSFETIVIHPRCSHMLEEAKLYRHKVDKITGDVLPDIVDAHNHGWDSVRYALQPAIRQEAEDVVVLGEEVHISSDLDEAEMMQGW